MLQTDARHSKAWHGMPQGAVSPRQIRQDAQVEQIPSEVGRRERGRPPKSLRTRVEGSDPPHLIIRVALITAVEGEGEEGEVGLP
jgi:hypothetical protein